MTRYDQPTYSLLDHPSNIARPTSEPDFTTDFFALPMCTNGEASVRAKMTALLEYEGKDILVLPRDEIVRVNWIADHVRERSFGPLYVCRLRTMNGTTNFVYVEANYPWTHPNQLVLRFSSMDPNNPGIAASTEVFAGPRTYPSKCEVKPGTTASPTWDILVIHTGPKGLGTGRTLVYRFEPRGDQHGLGIPVSVENDQAEPQIKGQPTSSRDGVPAAHDP